jgi:hypothetical protein
LANELKIKQKHEDFVAYAYVALKHMPKSERFTLVADIKNSLFRILELIIRANKTRNRLPVLYDLDIELELLRTKVRLAMTLGYLPFKKYEIMANYMAELGRMLGGWIKQTSSGRSSG